MPRSLATPEIKEQISGGRVQLTGSDGLSVDDVHPRKTSARE